MPDREKVIRGIEACIQDQPKCGKCPYFRNDECKSGLRPDALELLKEQEAVKPDHPEEVWLCGNCGEIVGWDDWVISTDDVRHNYCPKCGRKVKWDD